MCVSSVDAKLKELRITIEANSQLLPILHPYWSSDPSCLIETYVQAQFRQVRSWFEQLYRDSYIVLREIQSIIETFVDFQRDRPVEVPDLRDLQRICETFFQHLLDINEQFSYVHNSQMTKLMCILDNYQESIFMNWWFDVGRITQELIKSTLIYEKQPSSIIRKERIFDAKVRWLIGTKLGSDVIKGLSGTVSILNEDMVNSVQQGRYVDEDNSSVLNNDAHFEISHEMEVYAKLNNCKLLTINRNNSKNIDKKIDEKYAVMFRTRIRWDNQELDIPLISLPICLTTHKSQDEYCFGIIVWDNAFCERNRHAFLVPNSVSWFQFANLLSKTWESWIGCPLANDHIKYLYDKIYNEHPNCEIIPARSVTWNHIARDHFNGMDFTFWSWFYSAMKLIKDKFGDHWKLGHIHGFIHKDHAKALLETKPVGTFLFRFSESKTGNMSIDVALNSNPRVSSCGPFSGFVVDTTKQTEKDTKTLNEFITNFVTLEYLYPSIPKSSAFSTDCGSSPSKGTGYKSVRKTWSI